MDKIKSLAKKSLRWLKNKKTKALKDKFENINTEQKRLESLKSKLPIISRLPGFVYGHLRNTSGYRYYFNSPIARVRIRLVDEHPEVMHFNYVGIWIRNTDGSLSKYTGEYNCDMSTVSQVLPDPNAVMSGSESNSVSVHSKKELKPWWQVTFPHAIDIACIELYNRKDLFGKRLRGLVLDAYDGHDKRVSQQSRVTKIGANKAFNETGLTQLKQALDYAKANSAESLANNVEQNFIHWLTSESVDEKQKLKLISDLETLNKVLTLPTPDIAGEPENAAKFEIPQKTRFIRIVAFAKTSIRKVTLNISALNETHLLSPSTNTHIPNDIFKLKDTAWVVKKPHIYTIEIPEQDTPHIVSIWHGGFYSASAFVQRLVQVSEDGSNWTTLESTLDCLSARLALITAQEWVLGDKWTDSFVKQVGELFATYRITQARTVKPLLRQFSDLKAPFYLGIEAGATSARYIPNVTYTRHGLTVPFSEIDSTFLAKRTQNFCEYIKAEFDLDAFPCYGTLLGMHRDDDFLPHDDDIDVAVIVDVEEGLDYRKSSEKWAKRLERKGIKTRFPTPTSLNIHCYFEDFDMDLFFMYRMPQKGKKKFIWTHMQGYKTRKVNANLLEPLSSIEFKGLTFNAPSDIEGILLDRYGEGWVTPDPHFEL